jgi:hypothetical protein
MGQSLSSIGTRGASLNVLRRSDWDTRRRYRDAARPSRRETSEPNPKSNSDRPVAQPNSSAATLQQPAYGRRSISERLPYEIGEAMIQTCGRHSGTRICLALPRQVDGEIL